jgi:predicted metal-dependent hydrolase
MTEPADIIPRDLRFGVLEAADPAWFGGDRLLSAMVDGFAVMLPAGERLFIRSLKHYAPDITDQEVLDGIRGYALQEAFHTREHEAYNAALRRLGFDVDAMEGRVERLMARDIGPVLRLASTCAIEQVTYALSRFVLKRPALMARAAPAYRRLWNWHALEEVEHSSVALKALRLAPTGLAPWQRYVVRVATLHVIFVRMLYLAVANMLTMLREPDGRVPLRVKLGLAWRLLGRPGFIWALVVPFCAVLRPGYEGGGGRADAALVAQGRRLLAEDPPPMAAAA